MISLLNPIFAKCQNQWNNYAFDENYRADPHLDLIFLQVRSDPFFQSVVTDPFLSVNWIRIRGKINLVRSPIDKKISITGCLITDGSLLLGHIVCVLSCITNTSAWCIIRTMEEIKKHITVPFYAFCNLSIGYTDKFTLNI